MLHIFIQYECVKLNTYTSSILLGHGVYMYRAGIHIYTGEISSHGVCDRTNIVFNPTPTHAHKHICTHLMHLVVND